MSEEDREIFLTKEEVLKLPTHIKLAIVHRFPEKWHIIRKATLELLTTGKSPTYTELEAHARQIWRKPYTPWFLLKIRWERAGIEIELVKERRQLLRIKRYQD